MQAGKPLVTPSFFRTAHATYALMLLGISVWTGCAPKEQLPPEVRELLLDPEAGLRDTAPEGNSGVKSDRQNIELAEVSEENWIDVSQLPWTYAEIHFLRGARIGYSIMRVSPSELSEFKQLLVQRTDVIDRSSDGSPIPIREANYEAYERPNGDIASFKFLSTVDGQPELEVEGRMIFDNLDVKRREQQGRQRRQQIPWTKGTWGPLGIQSLLMRSPMQLGEIREAQIYFPQSAKFLKARLEAKEIEVTPIAGQSHSELLRIDVQVGTPESGMQSNIWTDETGIIQKTVTLSGEPILKIRVEEEAVLRIADQSRFGRLVQREIELSGDSAALNANPLTVEIQSLELDPYGKFLKNYRQDLRSLSAGTCQITAGDLESQPADSADDQSDESYLATSVIIPSDSILIAEIASQLLGDEPPKSPSEIAIRLREGMNMSWTLKPVASEIRSTLAAARARSGSCIECASVFSALLRQQQIPSRLVGGLLIDSEAKQARFHVWNQAWIGGAWIDFDATQPNSVGPLHLAMTTTAAIGENPYQSWIPVLEVFQEILDIRIPK